MLNRGVVANQNAGNWSAAGWWCFVRDKEKQWLSVSYLRKLSSMGREARGHAYVPHLIARPISHFGTVVRASAACTHKSVSFARKPVWKRLEEACKGAAPMPKGTREHHWSSTSLYTIGSCNTWMLYGGFIGQLRFFFNSIAY
jgi:hypothetical protein